MPRNLITKLVALIVLVGALSGSGMLLGPINENVERHSLRYTNTSVESAPPWIAIGTSIGALRGILVDVLWLRVQFMKEKGLFFEAASDADLITKLQPRFAPVWGFHGHNMAYNISVATHTQQERWSWVQKGIDLVRNSGLRYNPNSLELYKELAFWFAHKLEGVADDAHLYYKKEFARKWHKLLGEPPQNYDDRIAWIKEVADAPNSLAETDEDVRALVDNLHEALGDIEEFGGFDLDSRFLFAYAEWQLVNSGSRYAQAFNLQETLLAAAEEENADWKPRMYKAINTLAADPARAEAWDKLIAFTRRKVLREEYNMDAQLMYEYTRDLGPIDWRHGSAHSLYWAKTGERKAELRSRNDDDIFKIINNDRMWAQAMQDLARSGLIEFDPLSNDVPTRLPDPRWYEPIEEAFQELYLKHRYVRGWGPDNYIAWHKNFFKSAVRELYRMGEIDEAQKWLDRLDRRYGTGAVIPSPEFAKPLDVFVQEQVEGEYEMQPHVAITDVQNALYFGLRRGLGKGDEERYERTRSFAQKVIRLFKENEYNHFVNKFGEGRIKDLIGELERSEAIVFARIMRDMSIPLAERIGIWNRVNDNRLRVQVYDLIFPTVARHIFNDPAMKPPPNVQTNEALVAHVQRFIPPPPGLEEYRARVAAERARQAGGQQEDPNRADIRTR